MSHYTPSLAAARASTTTYQRAIAAGQYADRPLRSLRFGVRRAAALVGPALPAGNHIAAAPAAWSQVIEVATAARSGSGARPRPREGAGNRPERFPAARSGIAADLRTRLSLASGMAAAWRAPAIRAGRGRTRCDSAMPRRRAARC